MSTYTFFRRTICIYIYMQMVTDERITLCEYTTQSFMFYTFVRYTFLFYLKKQGQNIFCSFTIPQAFWESSVPGPLSTLETSVVLYSLTRATLIIY